MNEMIGGLGNGFGLGGVMTQLVKDNYDVLNECINNPVIKTFGECFTDLRSVLNKSVSWSEFFEGANTKIYCISQDVGELQRQRCGLIRGVWTYRCILGMF